MTQHQKVPPSHFKYEYVQALHYYRQTMATGARDHGEKGLDDAKRKLGETDLFFFIVFILNRADLNKEWLFDRCREVQLDPDDHLDLWAREHYKSTIITFGMTIFDIVNNPEITIGIFSHTKSIARDFLVQIKTELENNPELPRLWSNIFYEKPKSQSPSWSRDGGIVVKREGNPKEMTIEGHGLVDGMPTGRHFTLMIYDDVVTKESVNTPDQIQKTTESFQLSDNLGAVGGARRYIGTRYHLFDTYSVIISDEIAIPRLYPATENGKEYGKPVLMDEETLRKKRKTQGPFIFAAQMLLNPTADKAMGFQEDWIEYADTDYRSAMSSLWRFIIVDPSGGKQRKNNDFTSMFVIGYGLDGKYRVLDMVRDRLSLSGKTDTLIELHQKWKPHLVAYEEYGMQSDVEHIKYVQEQLLYEFDIIPLGGSMRKELRILRLVPLFENGYVSVEEGGDGIPKSRIILPTTLVRKDYQDNARDLVKAFVEEEYTAFPVLKHDDMMDCLARIVDLEKDHLIQKPTITAPKLRSQRVEEGLRRMGKKGNESWITA